MCSIGEHDSSLPVMNSQYHPLLSPPPIPLPAGITSRFVHTSPHSLTFHVLEAGRSFEQSRPLIILVHGFPELAYSWRRVMPMLADKGYYVVAFDQRGYG